MPPLHQLHKQRNRLDTILLLGGMLLLLLTLCTSLFGSDGLLLMLFSILLLLLFTPRASAWLTLRIHHARQLSFNSVPGLYRIVDRLAYKAGLPQTPILFYIPSGSPNAFAMLEHDQPLIAVTDALLRQLNQDELTAVLAHEISHIRNGDLQIMMVAELLNRLTSILFTAGWMMLVIVLPLWLLSDISIPWLTILLLLTAPLATTLMQLALSRTREFDADLDAALLTRDPATLAAALIKIDRFGANWWSLLLPTRSHADTTWARSHPSTAERVRRLRALEAEQQQQYPSWHHPFLMSNRLMSEPDRPFRVPDRGSSVNPSTLGDGQVAL